jgi:hypothetical protein
MPRSYDVLERLVAGGLALVQPGDPPHYRAVEPEQLIERLRAEHRATLDALTAGLEGVPRTRPTEDFWVLRRREAVVAEAQRLIAAADRRLLLWVGAAAADNMLLGAAEERAGAGVDLRIVRAGAGAAIGIVADGEVALAGVLPPDGGCEVALLRRPEVVSLLERGLIAETAIRPLGGDRQESPADGEAVTAEPRSVDWLAWEDQKQRRLRLLNNRSDVA